MNKFILFAGPCVIESAELCIEIASFVSEIADKLGLTYYFKASFDKANRTSIHSFRGPGLDEGLRILDEVKRRTGVKIITDIHEPHQAKIVSEFADVLQIPAYLCRQTDLLKAAAETGRKLNIKKGQFMSPYDMEQVVKKLEYFGNTDIILCERGTMFGYNNLVVDFTAIPIMKKFGYPVIFDGTHSLQQPGGNGTSSGGRSEFVPHLCRAAAAVGIDGLFLEVHPEPEKALSDSTNSLKLSEISKLLENVLKINEIIQ